MDFIDSVFSFIPLLMIIIFFMRIVSSSKKRNRPGSVNSLTPAAKEQKREKTAQSRLEALLQGKFSKAAPPRTSAGSALSDNQPPTETKPKPAPRPPEPQSLNTLNNSKKGKPAPQERLQKESALKRVNTLPDLKKAVIWSEIIGKPKGLD